MSARFVGFAIGNRREEFLASFNEPSPGQQLLGWALTPGWAIRFHSLKQALRMASRLHQSGIVIVEIYDAGHEWLVNWPDQYRTSGG